VAQAVRQSGGHVHEVVGQRTGGQLDPGERVDDVGVVVQALQQVRQRLPQRVHVGVGTGVGLELLTGYDVGDGTEAGTRDEHLRDAEQQDGQGGLGLAAGGDLGERLEVGAGLAGGVVGHRRQGVVVTGPCGRARVRGHGSSYRLATAQSDRSTTPSAAKAP
jgi:hypothetical protein